MNDEDKSTEDQTARARGIREDLAAELEALAHPMTPTERGPSMPGVALSTVGPLLLLVTLTPELAAELACVLSLARLERVRASTHHQPQERAPNARHLLTLRRWIEPSAAVVLEWRATHAIEIRQVRSARPCTMTGIRITRTDGTWRTYNLAIHGNDGDARTRLVPPIRVDAGETISVTLANPLEQTSGGEADLFYEPIE